jgi:Family of unknown function (DUF5990)
MTASPSVSRRSPATRIGTLTVEIIGTDLPGRTCGPDMDGEWYEDVRVGLARGIDTIELVPGDAASVRWTFDVELAIDEEGKLDQRGPFVHGPRGERHLGLRWVRRDADGRDVVFRGAKFRLFEMDSRLFEEALGEGRRLVGTVGLTDEDGWPRCATVRPPVVSWTVA